MPVRVRADVAIAFGSVKGPVRTENQDDFLVHEPQADEDFARLGRLLAVADGMGGGPGGAEASRTALRGLLAAWLDAGPGGTGQARLVAAYRRCCERVAEEARKHPLLLGMGTTLTALSLTGARVTGVHVGDSRCLLVQEGAARWLTSLHVGAVDDNRLTRAVGAGRIDEEPETFEAELRPGDRLALLTDGVWRGVSEEECVATLLACPPREAVELLLARAQAAYGQDNATLVVLDYRGGDERGPAVEVGEAAHAAGALLEIEPRRPSRWQAAWPWLALAAGLAMLLGGALMR